MRKLLLIIFITLIMGCTSVQRNYIKETEPVDAIYLETSGLFGFAIGVGITSLSWYAYNKLDHVLSQ